MVQSNKENPANTNPKEHAKQLRGSRMDFAAISYGFLFMGGGFLAIGSLPALLLGAGSLAAAGLLHRLDRKFTRRIKELEA